MLPCWMALVAFSVQAGAPPARLQLQPLRLTAADGTDIAAEAGRLTVQETRGRPADGGEAAGRSIELAFIRLPSTAEHPGPPTVFLQGGPGQPATPIAHEPDSLQAFTPFLSLGDLILLDPRGVGESTPSLSWQPDTQPDLPREFFADHELARRLLLQSEQELRAHFEAEGVDLAAYNTESCADDVDELRAALGVEKVNLIGFSYGTLLAQTVVRRHPEHVGRVILIGTEGPRDWGSLPSTLQAQLGKLSLLAARDESVNHAVPDMTALLERVLTRLDAQPLEVRVTDARTGEEVPLLLGRWGLEFLIRIDVGDGNDFPLFPALLWTLDQGRTDVVGPLLGKRYNQLRSGSSAMAQAVRYAYGPTPEQEHALRDQQEACTFRFMANYFDLDNRPVWRVPLHADAFREHFATDVPALFVSGTLDSNAPPYQAEWVRWSFLDSVHIVVDNAGHEDLLPDADVRDAMLRFLGGEDVSEVRIRLPSPAFVGIRRAH